MFWREASVTVNRKQITTIVYGKGRGDDAEPVYQW